MLFPCVPPAVSVCGVDSLVPYNIPTYYQSTMSDDKEMIHVKELHKVAHCVWTYTSNNVFIHIRPSYSLPRFAATPNPIRRPNASSDSSNGVSCKSVCARRRAACVPSPIPFTVVLILYHLRRFRPQIDAIFASGARHCAVWLTRLSMGRAPLKSTAMLR